MSSVVAQLLLLLVLGLLRGFAYGCVCGLGFCCGERHRCPLCSLKALKNLSPGCEMCLLSINTSFLPGENRIVLAVVAQRLVLFLRELWINGKNMVWTLLYSLQKICLFVFSPSVVMQRAWGCFPPFCHMFLDSCRTVAGFAPGQLKAMGGSVEPTLPSLPRRLKWYFPPAEPYKVFLHMHFSRL